MHLEEIMVSICCITYNHGKYISEALNSFLMQKTNFKYEIIIRDDGSTDGTADIIREYEKKYPNIIKPIYEKENQYSKGITKVLNIVLKKAIGKYIAICEGDDYWIDENKLQKQFDYMEANPNCTLCFHNGMKYNILNNKKTKFINKNCWKFLDRKIVKSHNFNAGEMMLIGLCAEFPTASMFLKNEGLNDLPNYYYSAPCEDMPLKFASASKGYAHYMEDVMCIYRMNYGTSVMDKWNKENIQGNINKNNEFIKLIQQFDEASEKKYSKELYTCIKYYEITIYLLNKDLKNILKNQKIYKKKFKDYFFIKLLGKILFPKLATKIRIKRGRK